MKRTFAIACLIMGGSLAAPVVSHPGEDADIDRGQPSTFVKDYGDHDQDQGKASVRTSRQPDADQRRHRCKRGRMAQRHCEDAIRFDKAVAIAKGTDGVVTVKNSLKVKPA